MTDATDPTSQPPSRRRSEVEELVDLGTGIARITAGAAIRTATWSVDAYVRTARRVAQAAVSGESPTELFDELRRDARRNARDFLGLDEPVAPDGPGLNGAAAGNGNGNGHAAHATAHEALMAEDLRRRGAELLARSSDVEDAGDGHPAYARIVSELAPDEARVLRLLCSAGPQPAVDVRSAKVPLVSSELVAPGLTMIGAEAGVRRRDRTQAYLNNLERLGLIWFSREPLEPHAYQVLEAQPEVVEALRRVGRGKTVRRSIHLTPFGEDFCRTVLGAPGP